MNTTLSTTHPSTSGHGSADDLGEVIANAYRGRREAVRRAFVREMLRPDNPDPTDTPIDILDAETGFNQVETSPHTWADATEAFPLPVGPIRAGALRNLWAVPERLQAALHGETDGPVPDSAREATAQIFGNILSARDLLHYAGKLLQFSDGSNDWPPPVAAPGRAVPTAGHLFEDMIAKAVLALVSIVPLNDATGQGHLGLFQHVSRRASFYATALRSASVDGHDFDTLAGRIHDLLRTPSNQMRAVAEERDEHPQFPTAIPILSGANTGLDLSREHTLPAAMLAPIFDVVINLRRFRFADERLHRRKASLLADIAAGGSRRELALSKLGLAALGLAVGIDLAAGAQITGSGPLDTKRLRSWNRTGFRADCVKLDGGWVPYDRAEPVGLLLGMAADYYDVASSVWLPELDELAAVSVVAMTEVTTSRSWIAGVADVLSRNAGGAEVSKSHQNGKKPFRSQGDSMPSSTGSRLRHINAYWVDIVAAYKSVIPGLAAELPLRRNLWGMKLDGPGSTHILSTLLPVPGKESPLDGELVRLGWSPRSLGYQIDGILLTPHEYDRFAELAGLDAKHPISGRGLHRQLSWLIQRPHYRNAPDSEKRVLLRRTVAMFRDLARKILQQEQPDLRSRIETATDWRPTK